MDPSPTAPLAGAGAGAGPPRPSSFTGGGAGFRGVILIIILMALAVGSVAMASASFIAFSRVLMATVDSRLLEVANEIARHVDDGLQAGVTLGQQRRLLEVLDGEQTQAPNLSDLRVLDERNVIAFSTNRAEIGEAIPEATEPGLPLVVDASSAPGTLRRAIAKTIRLERPMTGLFGEPVGRVLVSLPSSIVADQRQRYATSLAFAVIGITLGGGLLTALLLYLVPLPPALGLAALRGRLDRLFVEAAAGTPDAPPRHQAALPDALGAFEAAARQRLQRLSEREAALQRMDEDA